MSDDVSKLTKQLFSVGQKRHDFDLRVALYPLLAAIALLCLIVLLVALSLPPIRGPGFDKTEYFREYATTSVLFPRVLPIGLFSGVAAFVLALRLGEQRSRYFTAFILCVASVAVIVALAIVSGNGLPSPNYLGADAVDVFLVTLIPIGLPLVLGAIVGGRVAAIS